MMVIALYGTLRSLCKIVHLKLNKDILTLIKGKRRLGIKNIKILICDLLFIVLLEYRGNDFVLNIKNLSS